MSTPSDPQATALLAHVVAQMQHNVDFLVSQNYISQSDASTIVSKLPVTLNGLPQSTPGTSSNVTPAATPPRRGIPPPATASQTVQARAVWAYNENGQEADDLSFAAGDIIEIVEETNADWWMGKINGKQALFPSGYVKKITSAPPVAARSIPPIYSPNNNNFITQTQPDSKEKPVYKPFMAAHHGADAPPSSSTGGVNSVGLQQDVAGQDKKKSKFGKYGNTMAHSAAGGVGFGAGAAIGGGLVRAIF